MATSRKKKKQNKYSLPILVAFLIIALISTLLTKHSDQEQPSAQVATTESTAQVAPALPAPHEQWELPLSTRRPEQVIEHLGYTVGYNSAYHLPNWVAYCLEPCEVDGECTRTDKFLPDPLVEGSPVVTKDYSGSGYDRGHMAPAADMRWSEQAMKESFYMTNMCPQNHNNNAGDWKDLEELVRSLARQYGNIYICCGPIVTDDSHTIGTDRKIVVPQSFYKVLLRQKKDGNWTAIGFVMPNAAGNRPLMTYMQSIDDVEEMTGINFFHALPDDIETLIEKDYTIADWTVQP